KRGTTAQIWVKNVKSYVPIPFLMSSGGWAVFSNTTYRHNFDICDTDSDILRIFGYYGEMDMIFFTGDDYLSLLNQYTAVSGRPALLPKFGYGLTFVCNQQADARELIDDCLRFRDRDIPCDVIGLEPGWMETYYNKTVNKKFDKERFYIPEWSSGPSENTFAAAVKRLGFKLSLWMCCDYDLSFEEERNAVIPLKIDEHDEQMDYLPSKDDFEQDQNIGHEPLTMDQITVRDQGFFEHLKEFVDLGARAFKMDGAWQVNEHPDRKWGNGMDDVQMHNLYPLILNKQMSTGFTEHTGCRSMIYSSGGFAGIQQYAATWAGDTGGGPKPLVSMLNHAMSGHVNTSCDMHVFSKEGIHFGFLQSWSQVCSWAYWRHPWTLGKELEDVFRYYAKLRYSLIPYIYSTAYQAYLTGMPIMRPLSFLYPGDPKADDHMMEYMLGDSLLVTCYTDDLYLPEGKWTDCFTGREYNGPFVGKYDIPEDKGGALFIKGGSIIPSQTPQNYIGETQVNQLILDIYPDGDSVFTIYDDDGMSMDYKDGKRSEILVTCSENKDNVQVVISGRHGSYDGMVENLSLLVNIYAPRPVTVTLNMET
ncbi:MAG: glycoside hydrolase family 31 protein, partial [Clostridia bacterium]|nr:glycoside hydrolase family 31 protein [Clostridia bacterium]